jgi:hypothetical protein
MQASIGEESLVIVHCGNPREKMWGAVERLDGVGLVLRGLDLESVEDWIRQERAGSEKLIGPTTFFVPMHRVLRIDLDDDGPVVESYHNRFAAACGRDALEVLLETSGRDA